MNYHFANLRALAVVTWILAALSLVVGIVLVSANQEYDASLTALTFGFIFVGIGATMLPAAFIVSAIGEHAANTVAVEPVPTEMVTPQLD
jgi:hypothetical protein